jgi:MscS family membrane protein
METAKCSVRASALFAISLCLLLPAIVWCQAASPINTASPAPAPAEVPKDTIGRGTPRGTVLGFLNAARKGNDEVAALYLNTPLRGDDSALLAKQLAVVLDRKLPARLNQISDKPEGSVPDPLKPDEDLIGTITTADGQLDIVVERVDRGKAGKVWLFSRKTLTLIPSAFQELSAPAVEQVLPKFLVNTRVGGVQLFEWLALFLGLPFLYFSTGVLNRALAWSIGNIWRRLKHNETLKNPQPLRIPERLLMVAGVIYLLLKSVSLPLLARQFWSTAALFITGIACIWWLFLLNRSAERYLIKRRPSLSGSASVLRLFRRLIDGLILFAGFLLALYHFGVELTAALAGLGVGGIAVALAAQKTLENVIGGVSLIADQALSVGDFLNLGDVQGTVEDVGLRSTRIRTLDRTLVSLPNGQIAGMRLETLSARDKFWFHPIIGLRYETSPTQLHSVLSGTRTFLSEEQYVESSSIRVRFIRIGNFSFDVEIFAYIFAIDWNDFLEIQERLLFGIIEIVQKAGTALAFPSQTLYFTDDSPKNSSNQASDNRPESARSVA